jgi:hypothetical protein
VYNKYELKERRFFEMTLKNITETTLCDYVVKDQHGDIMIDTRVIFDESDKELKEFLDQYGKYHLDAIDAETMEKGICYLVCYIDTLERF